MVDGEMGIFMGRIGSELATFHRIYNTKLDEEFSCLFCFWTVWSLYVRGK